MAKIADGVLKQWQNGETVTAEVYYQEREMLRVGLNDVDTNVNNANTNIQIISEELDNTNTTMAGIQTTVTNLQTNKADKSTTYTRTEVDTSLGLKANKADVYTKIEGDARYVKVVNMPTTIAGGQFDTFQLSAGAQKDLAITYPAGMFTDVPYLNYSILNQDVDGAYTTASSITTNNTTGANIRLKNKGTNLQYYIVYWQAVR